MRQLPRNQTQRAANKFLSDVMKENPNLTAHQIAVEKDMSTTEVLKMRLFVNEYLRDHSIENAALRMSLPYEEVQQMFYHPFTQLHLFEVMNDKDRNSIVSGNQIISALWKEANVADTEERSNAANRISALKELAKIMRLHQDVIINQQQVNVMQVPSNNDWNTAAQQSQKKLKEEVVDV